MGVGGVSEASSQSAQERGQPFNPPVDSRRVDDRLVMPVLHSATSGYVLGVCVCVCVRLILPPKRGGVKCSQHSNHLLSHTPSLPSPLSPFHSLFFNPAILNFSAHVNGDETHIHNDGENRPRPHAPLAVHYD